MQPQRYIVKKYLKHQLSVNSFVLCNLLCHFFLYVDYVKEILKEAIKMARRNERHDTSMDIVPLPLSDSFIYPKRESNIRT